MNEPRQPAALRLTPPVLRTALLFAASLIWLVFGGYLFVETRSVLPAILALLGLISAVIYGLALIPGGSYLETGPNGLTIGASFRKRSLAWADVEEFSVRQLGRKKKLVRYRLAPRTGEGARLAAARHLWAGGGGSWRSNSTTCVASTARQPPAPLMWSARSESMPKNRILGSLFAM